MLILEYQSYHQDRGTPNSYLKIIQDLNYDYIRDLKLKKKVKRETHKNFNYCTDKN